MVKIDQNTPLKKGDKILIKKAILFWKHINNYYYEVKLYNPKEQKGILKEINGGKTRPFNFIFLVTVCDAYLLEDKWDELLYGPEKTKN